jgi:hypothetical protein
MLVYDAPKELPSLWAFFLCGLSILYLAHKAYSLVRPSAPTIASPQRESVPHS